MRRDIAIVGGGPAGLACSIEAASRGLSVVLLERRAFPCDKACGEGVMPEGLRVLEALGIRALLSPNDCAPFRGIRYEQEDGSWAEGSLPDGGGLGIRRVALSAAMVARAREEGVDLREQAFVKGFQRAPNSVLLDTSLGPIEASLLIAADGLASPLRRAAGREGRLGELVAMGSRRAAGAVGGGSIDFAPQVKGMEMPGYHPGAMRTMALGLAVAARGADHNRSGAYEADLSEETDRLEADPGKGALAKRSEDRAALMDSLILCKFLRGVFADLPAEAAALLGLVTGWPVDGAELEAVGERVVNLRRLYNLREGATRDEDTLPARFLEGGGGLGRERLAAMIAAYDSARGWSAEGVPTPGTLRRLGLDALAAGGNHPREASP
ncbi:MAG: FAD-dependent monooxygenase [Planctomycetaceae bacterium]|nr:FAD-dependent monooxygenase [Planctomycetaceae bacterium]